MTILPRTLRARFALWTAALFLVGLSTFGAFVYASMSSGLRRAMDESLALVAAQVAAGLDLDGGRVVFSEDFATEPENENLRARGLTVRILDSTGTPLTGFGPAADRLPLVDRVTGGGFATLPEGSGGDSLRLHSIRVEAAGDVVAFVQVAQATAEVEGTLTRLRTALLVSIPLLVLLVGVGGWFLAARALSAIDRITRTARDIAEGSQDLSARLDLPDTGDEVGRLGETFDAMLARLETSFRRERQFTSDAAHELRTPLAAIQAILGVVRQRERTPAEYEQALDDLAGETQRLQTMTEALLGLARLDGRSGAAFTAVDLSTLLNDVTDSVRPLAEAKGLRLTRAVPEGLTVKGHRDDLARLFVNLLDNAIQFTDRGDVHVTAGTRSVDRVFVEVSDTGCGIPAEHLPRIFDRFYRVDPARSTTGAGLGLALAMAVVDDHGGTIAVASEVGRGSRFTVLLPGATEDGRHPPTRRPGR